MKMIATLALLAVVGGTVALALAPLLEVALSSMGALQQGLRP